MVINDGEIQQVGSPLALYNTPANQFVAGFIGAPKMNFIQAVLTGETLTLAEGSVLTLPTELAARLPQGEPIKMGVRPENIVRGQAIATKVINVEQLGHETHSSVQLGDELWTIKWPGQQSIGVGEQLMIAVQHYAFFDGKTGKAL